MAVQNQYKENDYTVVVAALNLAEYVIHITDNLNKFPDYSTKEIIEENGLTTKILVQRQDSLVNWVRDQVKQIYLLTYTANEINVKKYPWLKDERFSKQETAINICNEHLAAIQLCKKHFHLDSSKVKYWGSITVNLKQLIEKWNKNDKRRYKDI